MATINEMASIAEYNGTDRKTFEEGYIKGANSVLEQIERIVNSAIEHESKTIPTWRINFVIKQLKKLREE